MFFQSPRSNRFDHFAGLVLLKIVLIALFTFNSSGSVADDCEEFRTSLAAINNMVNSGDFDNALGRCDSLLKTHQITCNNWVQLYIQKGKIFAKTEQFEGAFRAYEEALSLSEGNPELLIEINMHIGSIYRRTSSHEKAARHLLRALRISKEEAVNIFFPDLYNSYANVLASSQMDSAIIYYEKSLEAHGEGCPSCRSTILNNIGSQYAVIDNPEKSIAYFNRALTLDTLAKDSLRLMRTLFNMGRVEYLISENGRAQQHFEEAIELAKKYKWNQSIPLMTNMIAGIAARRGEMKMSYDLLMKSAMFQDSLMGASAHNASANAMSSFELRESEMKNELLTKENEIIKKDQRLRSISLILAGLVVLFLLVLVLTVSRQRKNLAVLNDSLDSQNEQLKGLINEKDTFMGMLTHDLRTPLGNMVAILGMLKEQDIPESESKELLKDAESSAESGMDLLNDLITLYQVETQNESHELEELELGSFLRRTCQQYQVMCLAKGQEFSCTKEDGLFVQANETILKSAVGNLLSNAIKYTPLGGQVGVSAWAEDGKVKITIRDSGPGFTDEDKKKLFGKFQRLSAQPTGNETSSGLGLHLVKLMVEKLNGDIQLESKEGVGSTFTVSFAASEVAFTNV